MIKSRLSIVFIISSLVSLVFLAGCKEEKPLLDIDLNGKWKIYKASRNKKPTRTLDGAYFVFSGDESFKTNLDLDLERGADPQRDYQFTKEGAKLVVAEIEPPVVLSLSTVSQDSISLSTRLGVWKLAMHLVRDTTPADDTLENL